MSCEALSIACQCKHTSDLPSSSHPSSSPMFRILCQYGAHSCRGYAPTSTPVAHQRDACLRFLPHPGVLHRWWRHLQDTQAVDHSCMLILAGDGVPASRSSEICFSAGRPGRTKARRMGPMTVYCNLLRRASPIPFARLAAYSVS